jgi:xylulokinase
MSHLLGIDVGTSGTKVLLVDPEGKPVASATETYPLHTPKPNWSEQDPADWWAASAKATKAVLRKAGLKGSDVRAVGLSGQMHGSVFLDAAGKVLRRALLWNDQRTAKQCDDITRLAGGRDALIGMVSNPALTGFTAPKILWLRDNEPAKYEKIRRVLLPKDYIRFKLTGEFATEVSDASGTLLLDVKARGWCKPLLSKLGIPAEWMPAVHESTVVSGKIGNAAAVETGLAEGTPVVGGGGDCAAGAVGTGIVRSGVVSVSLGTSGVVFAHSDTVQTDPAGRVHTFCHAVPGKWHVMGVMLSAAGSLEWFCDALGEPEATAAAKAKKPVFEVLVDEMAAKTPVGCEGLMFLPYLTGERSPHADPTARGAWIGLTRRTDKAAMVRALLEGVTYGLRDSLEIIRGLGVPVGEVRALGGGAKSPFWRQMLADAFAAPIAQVSDEGAAFGVALLAGVGTGLWKDVPEACDATLDIGKKTKPRAKLTAAYDARYPLWQKLYRSLKSDFAEMAKLEG